MLTFVSALQKPNAPKPPPLLRNPSSMFVTLSGMVIAVRLVRPKNACAPMAVTGIPAMVAGMATLPPGPPEMDLIRIKFAESVPPYTAKLKSCLISADGTPNPMNTKPPEVATGLGLEFSKLFSSM